MILRKTIKISLVLIVIFLGLIIIGTFSEYANQVYEFSYIEDASAEMNIQEAENSSNFHAEKGQENGIFSFGNSSSAYWIKIPLFDTKPEKEYISVYNPMVKDVELYLPTKDGSVKILKSGWGAGENKQDEGMLYPVFHLDRDTDYGSYAYMRLYSDFTQNYKIDLLTEKEYNADRTYAFLLQGTLFGIMFCVALLSLIIFLQLKEKSFFCYFIYMAAFIVYQGCLSGMYNTISPTLSQNVMPFTIALSLVTTNALIVFSAKFFNIKEKMRTCWKIAVGLIFANFIFAVLSLFVPIITNLYAHLSSMAYILFLMYIAYKALNQGFKSAETFLIGISIVLFAVLVRTLRNSAFFSDSIFTLNILPVASVIQSILILLILIKYVHTLAEEKLKLATNYKLAEEKAYRAEVSYLRTQIKPHFLYNTLNTISGLCDVNAQMAGESLIDLSEFLRYSYDFDDKQAVVSIKKELEFITAYVRIEKLRFKDKWDITYDIDDKLSVLIPPLILQPLVENAIRHGVNKKKVHGHITLTVKEKDTHYFFEIKDDGRGMDEETLKAVLSGEHGSEVGISNINKRLQRHYKERLHIESRPGKGTTVYFKIPKGGITC